MVRQKAVENLMVTQGITFSRDEKEVIHISGHGETYDLFMSPNEPPVCHESENYFAFHRLDKFTRHEGQLIEILLQSRERESLQFLRLQANLLQKHWGQPTAIIEKPFLFRGLICKKDSSGEPARWLGVRLFQPNNLNFRDQSGRAIQQAKGFVRTHVSRLLLTLPTVTSATWPLPKSQ